MKKSNLFILSSALLIWGFYVGTNTLLGKYVTVSEFQNNKQESVKSLDTDTYNYKTVFFDEPFDEVIIRDTVGNERKVYSDRPNIIQWVKSEKSGLKRSKYAHIIKELKIENNKLLIYVTNVVYSEDKIILYSPSLNKIKIENATNLRLEDTANDSLKIESDLGAIEIAESNHLKKLVFQGKENSLLTVKAKFIDEAAYLLTSNSVVRSHIDTCNSLSIYGDNTSTVRISPLMKGRESPHSLYNYITYNDNMGGIVIENTTVNQIRGDKDKLTLNMTVKQIEETLRNVSTN